MVDFTTFCHDVRAVSTIFRGSVTSWGRTQERNAMVGGVANSWHLWERGGLAVDLMFDNDDNRHRAITAFRDLGYEVILYKDGHIHLEPA